MNGRSGAPITTPLGTPGSSTPSGGLFGGGTMGGAKPATGASAGGGVLFGGGGGGRCGGGTNSIGGAKPAAGTSGTSGTEGLFGGGGAKPAAGSSGGGGLFGGGTNSVGGAKSAAGTSDTGALFGKGGAKPAAGTSGGGGLFMKGGAGGGSLFGKGGAPAAGTSGGGGLFSSTPTGGLQGGTSTIGGAKSATGISGGGGLFGGDAKPAAGTVGTSGTGVLFGGGSAKPAAGTSGGGGLFGSVTSAVASAKPASATSGGTFLGGASGAAGGANPAGVLGPGNAVGGPPEKAIVLNPTNRQNGLHNRTSMRWMKELAQLRDKQNRGAMAQNSNMPYFFSYLANRGSGQNPNLELIAREKMHYDNEHLFRKIEGVRGKLIGERSQMQHMFYRVAENQDVVPGYKEHFIQLAQRNNHGQNPALTSPPDEQRLFWPHLSDSFWEKALYKEKLADDVNLPIMPDPVQGLEQLSDYIKIKTGMGELERKGQLAGGLNQNLRLDVQSTLDMVDESSDVFRTLHDKSEKCASRIKFIKRRHYALRHRLTKVVGMVERLRKKDWPVDEDDSRFRSQMNSLAAELNDPNAARALLDDMQYQIQISHSVKQRRQEKLNDMNAARAHEFLSHQVNALTVLKEVLERDLRDVQIILDHKGQAPNLGTGNTPHWGR